MKPEYIVIHHSLTKDSETVSWGAIRKYHTQAMGFRAVGYHYGVELIGGHYEILAGRMPNDPGAHTKEAGMNWKSIGVCCVGNFDVMTPPQAQIDKLAELVKWLMGNFSIPADHVIGHRDAGLLVGADWRQDQYKSCPGVRFPLEEFRGSL